MNLSTNRILSTTSIAALLFTLGTAGLQAQRYDYSVTYTQKDSMGNFFSSRQSDFNSPLQIPVNTQADWSNQPDSVTFSSGRNSFEGTYNRFLVETAADIDYTGIGAIGRSVGSLVSFRIDDLVTLVGSGTDPVTFTAYANFHFHPIALSGSTNKLEYSFFIDADIKNGGFGGLLRTENGVLQPLSTGFSGASDPLRGDITMTPGQSVLLSFQLELESGATAGRFPNGDHYDTGVSDLDVEFEFLVELPEGYSLISSEGFDYGSFAPVPEPRTYALLFGAAALIFALRRRK